MKKIRLIHYAIIGLFVVLGSCQKPVYTNYLRKNPFGNIRPNTFSPYTSATNIFILQGNITNGSIYMTTKVNYLKTRTMSENNYLLTKGTLGGFNVKQSDESSATDKRIDDIYKKVNLVRFVNTNDHISELLQKYTFIASADFKGTIHLFLNFQAFDVSGIPSGSGNIDHSLTYGTALANKLKEKGISYMDAVKKQRIGARESVIIDKNSEPKNIRALMQVAKAVKDPRLLVIERTSDTGKINITAFGETKPIDAGITYMWQFSETQIEKLRYLMITQCRIGNLILIGCKRR